MIENVAIEISANSQHTTTVSEGALKWLQQDSMTAERVSEYSSEEEENYYYEDVDSDDEQSSSSSGYLPDFLSYTPSSPQGLPLRLTAAMLQPKHNTPTHRRQFYQRSKHSFVATTTSSIAP